MLSPSRTSEVTSPAAICSRQESAPWTKAATRPVSSMMPVNMDSAIQLKCWADLCMADVDRRWLVKSVEFDAQHLCLAAAAHEQHEFRAVLVTLDGREFLHGLGVGLDRDAVDLAHPV